MDNKFIKSCLLCDGDLTKTAFPFFTKYNNRVFKYFKCRKCKSTCIHPIPDQNTFQKIYSKKNYHNIFYKSYNKKKYLNSVKYIKNYIHKDALFLDYGCGSGYFMKALDTYGYKSVGIDYDKKTILDLKKDFEVYTIDEFNEYNDRKFDVIHLGDTLEHTGNPVNLINYLLKKLSKKGLLFIEGPIERNLSLVNYSILFFGNLRNIFFPNLKRNHTPTHLFFVSLKSQISFFNQFDNLTVVKYSVFENGWPYKNNGFVKNLIANIAIKLGGKSFLSFIFGNRINLILKNNE